MYSTRFALTAAVCTAASAVVAAYYYVTSTKCKKAAEQRQPTEIISIHGGQEVSVVASARPSSALSQLRVLPSDLASVRDSFQQAAVFHVSTIAGDCKFYQASHAEQAPSSLLVAKLPPLTLGCPALPTPEDEDCQDDSYLSFRQLLQRVEAAQVAAGRMRLMEPFTVEEDATSAEKQSQGNQHSAPNNEPQVSEATAQQQLPQRPQTEPGSPMTAPPLAARPTVAAGLQNRAGPLPPIFEDNEPQDAEATPQQLRQLQPGSPMAAAPVSAPPPAAAGPISPDLPIWRGSVNPVLTYNLPNAENEQEVFIQRVRYQKMEPEPVGEGGSSEVYKVMDPLGNTRAVKRIALAGTTASFAAGCVDELNFLQRLQHEPNIIRIVDHQVLQWQGLMYIVLEFGETDLHCVLEERDAVRRAAASGAAASTALLTDIDDESTIRMWWQQMLQAVYAVHQQKIVHRDLKPGNFVLVGGQMKLIDFGIARTIVKDGQLVQGSAAGTLPYMAPEALCRGWTNPAGVDYIKLGRPSDVWSLGCILYEITYGRQPFAHLGTPKAMRRAIRSHKYQVSYPPVANPHLVDVLKRCMDRNPLTRITVQELLAHPFLHPQEAANTASAGGPQGTYRPLMSR